MRSAARFLIAALLLPAPALAQADPAAMLASGATLQAQGRWTEAEAAYRATLPAIIAHPGANPAVFAVLLGRLSDVLRHRGQLDEAQTMALRAIAIAKTTDQGLLAQSWLRLGKLALVRGDPAQAVSAGERALDTLAAMGDTSAARAQGYQLLARAWLARGQAALALDQSDRALSVLRETLPPDAPDRVDAESLRALVLARLGRSQDAWAAIAPVSQTMAARLANPNLAAKDLPDFGELYRASFARTADVALATGHLENAFKAAQLATIADLARTDAAPMTANAALATLPPKHALLLPVQSDDRLVIIAVTHDGLSGAAMLLDPSIASRAAAQLCQSGYHADAAWRLGQALFAPALLDALHGVDHVTLVGSGPLASLPLGLLLTAPPQPKAAPAYANRRFAIATRPFIAPAAQTPAPATCRRP